MPGAPKAYVAFSPLRNCHASGHSDVASQFDFIMVGSSCSYSRLRHHTIHLYFCCAVSTNQVETYGDSKFPVDFRLEAHLVF